MSNSPLVSYTKISPNRTSPRKHVIDTITIHCVVGQVTVERLGAIFAPTTRKASSNYGIGVDGKIGMYVEEKDRSWCTSSSSNDDRAITIEVASDTTHPYAVTDAAYKSLITLLTDICMRNDIKELKWKADKSLIGQPDKQNMTVHRWFANKACPGEYLYSRHAQIAAEVNERLGYYEKPDTAVKVENTSNTVTKNEEECDVNVKLLKKGAKGPDVKALQTLLIGYGYSCGSYGADGDFGAATDSAVRKYQKANGLVVDGYVGSATWGKLLGVK